MPPDSSLWQQLYELLHEIRHFILSFVLAVLISILSTSHKHGSIDWIEALICGFLTLACASTLNYLNLPSELSIFLGGFVGFKGSLWVDNKFNQKFNSITGLGKKEHNDEK